MVKENVLIQKVHFMKVIEKMISLMAMEEKYFIMVIFIKESFKMAIKKDRVNM